MDDVWIDLGTIDQVQQIRSSTILQASFDGYIRVIKRRKTCLSGHVKLGYLIGVQETPNRFERSSSKLFSPLIFSSMSRMFWMYTFGFSGAHRERTDFVYLNHCNPYKQLQLSILGVAIGWSPCEAYLLTLWINPNININLKCDQMSQVEIEVNVQNEANATPFSLDQREPGTANPLSVELEVNTLQLLQLLMSKSKSPQKSRKKQDPSGVDCPSGIVRDLLPLSPKRKLFQSHEQLVVLKEGAFEDHYILGEVIGKGSFGVVWKVTHRKLKLVRALKTIKKRANQHFSSFEEIEVLKKLDHTNILKIYEFYQCDNFYYLITELFQGKELFDLISSSDKLSEQLAASIIKEILKALRYTHSLGVVHRDLKPQNILIQERANECPKVKIIDWGLGTLIGDKTANRICGTPEYCAPEVLKGKYSLSCDMWSLGVITYVTLTGLMPFTGSNTQETIAAVTKGQLNVKLGEFTELSREAQKFILSLVSKNSEKRATAEDSIEHDWIKLHQAADKQPKYLKDTMARLKAFTATNCFGMAVVSFINNHLSSHQERTELEQVFSYLDSNADGVLSIEELTMGYTKIYGKILGTKYAEDIMSKIDLNQNGTLELSQFIAFGLKRETQQHALKLQQAFKLFDQDGDGRISCKEIKTVLKGKFDEQNEQEIQGIINQIDANSDGVIDFGEFIRCVDAIYHNVAVKKEKIGRSYKSTNKLAKPILERKSSVSRKSLRIETKGFQKKVIGGD